MIDVIYYIVCWVDSHDETEQEHVEFIEGMYHYTNPPSAGYRQWAFTRMIELVNELQQMPGISVSAYTLADNNKYVQI